MVTIFKSSTLEIVIKQLNRHFVKLLSYHLDFLFTGNSGFERPSPRIFVSHLPLDLFSPMVREGKVKVCPSFKINYLRWFTHSVFLCFEDSSLVTNHKTFI